MSNKKDGWQQKIHDVFYQPKEEDANSGGVTNVQIPDQMPATPVARQSVQVPIDATETEKYVAQFRAAVEGSNEIGAKFIQVLYNLAPNPEPSHYGQALNTMKVFCPTVSAQSILDSIEKCEKMITSETDNYVKQGEERKNSLEATRSTERSSLEMQVNEISTSIAALQKQLNDKNAELLAKQADLQKLDGKYKPQLDKITQTISEVSTASQTVLGGLSKVKEGITNNLK